MGIVQEYSNSVNVTQRSLREQRTQRQHIRHEWVTLDMQTGEATTITAHVGANAVQYINHHNGIHDVWVGSVRHRFCDSVLALVRWQEEIQACRAWNDFFAGRDHDEWGGPAYERGWNEAEEHGHALIDQMAEFDANRRFLERHNSREDV